MNIIKFNSTNNIFFTSDTHFHHENIMKFCNRPFKSVEEMDEVLISNWNSVVGKNDIIFHLGDFAFGGSEVWNGVLNRLNGKIHLILGNHDVKNIREGYMSKFESVSYQQLINVCGRLVYLNHFPFLCYAGSYRNPKAVIYQLYGHVHSRPHPNLNNIDDPEVKDILGKDEPRLQYTFSTQYDVGVDNNNFTPISFNEVNKIIQNQLAYGK